MPNSTPYERADEFIARTDRNIFITGKAGTGKTTFLHRLRKETTKQMAVVAPTGVAAVNAGGTTIHSFFQLPFGPFTPTPSGREALMSRMRMNASRRRVIRELELLVIDEVSMVRADVMDAIDTVLRAVRYRRSQPFGGVQMVFMGDMHQLSPVAKSQEWRILSQYYESIYFFHSHVIREQPPVYVEFDKIYRQSDSQFINVLNEVRNDNLSAEGLDVLQSRYLPDFNPSPEENYITLATHNAMADTINSRELEKIDGQVQFFEAEVKGDFPENAFPVDNLLELKEGAKVMFVKNDSEIPRRYFNGKIGTITRIEEGEITVQCPGELHEIRVVPASWENIRYTTDPESSTVEEEVVGTFTQIPLRLAWAITIHKSQGLTFDKAIIDAGRAFSPGQVYVALSRCRSLEGLVLKSPINQNSIEVDVQVSRFSSSKPDEVQIAEELNRSKELFRKRLLLQLYDFGPLVRSSRSWMYEIRDNESSFSEGTVPFIEGMHATLIELEQVAKRFRSQLEGILAQQPVDLPFLGERIEASGNYFSDKIDGLLKTLKETTATTDSRSNAQEYDDAITALYTAAAQKKHLITAMKKDFSVDAYYEARNRFRMEPFSATSYSRNTTGTQLKSLHPDLLNELIQLRNDISEEENLPVYIVAATKTLVQMADFLPQTEKELLKIHGFGKVKVKRFGARFLELIGNYISAFGIESRMIHFGK